MNNFGVMALDAKDAPPEILRELNESARKNDGKVIVGELSKSTQEWIKTKVGIPEVNEVIGKSIKEKYPDLVEGIELIIRCIPVLPEIMPEDESEKMLLDMYNACAEFIREYNTSKL